MNNVDHDIQAKLLNIFMPYSTKRREEIIEKKCRFVHYTSAENAMKIIQSRKIWMRNARCMNDYTEVKHGYELLRMFFEKDDLNISFVKALEPCGNKIVPEALNLFAQWWRNIHNNTFITSISEYDPDEDSHGRLSMWRAYGQQSAKAAIVINVPFGAPNVVNLFLVPAAYFNQEELNRKFNEVIDSIKDNENFLVSIDDQLIIKFIFTMLLMNAVSLKHVGFKEEKEWRIIYLPEISPSKLMLRTIETINGVPQTVYPIPLEDNPTENIIGFNISSVIEKVIIGPTVYPFSLYDAFNVALENAGVENAGTRVIVSGIPLRT